jgi:hypothetical protein
MLNMQIPQPMNLCAFFIDLLLWLEELFGLPGGE